ncbi:hypothetical protein EV182_007682, partial [Spiromyces aspiralis]
MNKAELFGRTVHVNVARPVWSEESWLEKHAAIGDAASSEKTGSGNEAKSSNPRVYIELEVDGRAAGRIEMELRADVVPKTA